MEQPCEDLDYFLVHSTSSGNGLEFIKNKTVGGHDHGTI